MLMQPMEIQEKSDKYKNFKSTMQTTHKITISDSRNLTGIPDDSIDLVVTSPPYPMIRMWDGLFAAMSVNAKNALDDNDGSAAFEAMHLELDRVWTEISRVLKPGSFACINVGDATRTIGTRFQLYPNHSRITSAFQKLGLDSLPLILWRKQTNAPNKFMGSGMLPAGAYVTLEHEYILVFRKGPKRTFTTKGEKALRMESAFFWEERNKWFSDVWDFKGASQDLNHPELRKRSAAFPFELPFRLINMYSLYGDIVLDPFMGIGTTGLAAIACGRSSVGVEIDESFSMLLKKQARRFSESANKLISGRLTKHKEFIDSRSGSGKPMKYFNERIGLPVFTRQEKHITVFRITDISEINRSEIIASYEPLHARLH